MNFLLLASCSNYIYTVKSPLLLDTTTETHGVYTFRVELQGSGRKKWSSKNRRILSDSCYNSSNCLTNPWHMIDVRVRFISSGGRRSKTRQVTITDASHYISIIVLSFISCTHFDVDICSHVKIQTWTMRTLKPVSCARPSLTFRQGFGLSSNDALKARRCWVVSIVLGRLGPRRPSWL